MVRKLRIWTVSSKMDVSSLALGGMSEHPDSLHLTSNLLAEGFLCLHLPLHTVDQSKVFVGFHLGFGCCFLCLFVSCN